MNPLQDALPPKVRKVLYAAAFVLLLAFSAYQAADGDWWEFAGTFLAALVPLLAASNTPTKPAP